MQAVSIFTHFDSMDRNGILPGHRRYFILSLSCAFKFRFALNNAVRIGRMIGQYARNIFYAFSFGTFLLQIALLLPCFLFEYLHLRIFHASMILYFSSHFCIAYIFIIFTYFLFFISHCFVFVALLYTFYFQYTHMTGKGLLVLSRYRILVIMLVANQHDSFQQFLSSIIYFTFYSDLGRALHRMLYRCSPYFYSNYRHRKRRYLISDMQDVISEVPLHDIITFLSN